MSDLQFYQNIPPFNNFTDVSLDLHFYSVPESWSVIITDLQGSTKAIENGRYQDVNLIGAATIAVLQENLDEDYPFVFGGDGATLVIPTIYVSKILDALCGLRELAIQKYDLHLRVGCVAMPDILAHQGVVEIAKYDLTSQQFMAMFRGGGISIAEKLIKNHPEKYNFENPKVAMPKLDGLSCTWQPIPSSNGSMMSLLVLPNPAFPDELDLFLMFLSSEFQGNIANANPVNFQQLQLKSSKQILADFRKINGRFGIHSLIRFVVLLVTWLSQWLYFPGLGSVKSGRLHQYLKSMPAHADFRKFDDVLRMVLDCSPAQIQSIEQYLSNAHQQGRLVYGIHLSQSALMTCLLEGIDDGTHIHFIDGGDGGYAMAATQFKKQLKAFDW